MSELSQISKDYRSVEDVLQHQRAQRESVKGKDTPYRVVFSYRGGIRSYQYFADLESARYADDRHATYGPTGRPVISKPTSQIIQVCGTRGGWKKLI